MSKRIHLTSVIGLVVVVSVLLAAPAMVPAETVSYREIFGNNTGVKEPLSYAGWGANYGATATEVASDKANVYVFTTPSERPGMPQNLSAVNSSPANAELAIGFVSCNTSPLTSYICWTTEVSGLGIATDSISKISWYQGNMEAAMTLQPAVKIGNNWYVANTTFTNAAMESGATFWSNAELKEFAFSTAQWKSLSFSPNSTLSMGSSIPLPSGTLNGVGLYATGTDTGWGGIRFDTFTITTIPEPSAIALLTPGLIALLCYAWKERK